MITFCKFAGSLEDINHILRYDLHQSTGLDVAPDSTSGKFKHDFYILGEMKVPTILNVMLIKNKSEKDTNNFYISICFNVSLGMLETFDEFKDLIKNNWLIEDMEIYNFDVYEKIAGYINPIRESVGLEPIYS